MGCSASRRQMRVVSPFPPPEGRPKKVRNKQRFRSSIDYPVAGTPRPDESVEELPNVLNSDALLSTSKVAPSTLENRLYQAIASLAGGVGIRIGEEEIETNRIKMDLLPEELLVHIFTMLRPHDVLNCSKVCRRWMRVSGDDELVWKKMCELKWGLKLANGNRPLAANDSRVIQAFGFSPSSERAHLGQRRWSWTTSPSPLWNAFFNCPSTCTIQQPHIHSRATDDPPIFLPISSWNSSDDVSLLQLLNFARGGLRSPELSPQPTASHQHPSPPDSPSPDERLAIEIFGRNTLQPISRATDISWKESLFCSRTFAFSHLCDNNGAIRWLCTHLNRSRKFSPTQVIVTSSGTQPGMPEHLFLNTKNRPFNWTKNQPFSWYAVDLGSNYRMLPTRYTLRYSSSGNSCCPRNWELQASNVEAINYRSHTIMNWRDGWTTLVRHTNDKSLNSEFATASWEVSTQQAFRYFRVIQTGVNCSSANIAAKWSHVFVVGGFELYGAMISLDKHELLN